MYPGGMDVFDGMDEHSAASIASASHHAVGQRHHGGADSLTPFVRHGTRPA
jgi:hypothetical protein